MRGDRRGVSEQACIVLGWMPVTLARAEGHRAVFEGGMKKTCAVEGKAAILSS